MRPRLLQRSVKIERLRIESALRRFGWLTLDDLLEKSIDPTAFGIAWRDLDGQIEMKFVLDTVLYGIIGARKW